MFPNRPMVGSSWNNSNASQAQQQFPYQTGQGTTPQPSQNQMQQQWYQSGTAGPSKIPFQQQWSVPSTTTQGQTAAEPSPTTDQPALPTGPPPGPKPPPPNEPPVPPSDEKPPLPPEPPPEDPSATGSKELKPQGPDELHKLNQLQEQAQQWQQQQTPGYQQYPYQQSAWQQHQQPWQQQHQQNWNWNYQQPPPPQQPAQMNVPPPQQQYPGYGSYNQAGGFNAPPPGQMNVPPPQPTQPPPVPVNTPEMEAVISEEKQFNIQYQEWRQQYDDWKSQNQNHPDKDLFTQYEQQWKQYESQMEDQRMSIVKRKNTLQASTQSKTPLPQSSADHPDIPTSSASGSGPDKPLNFNESRMPPVSGPPSSSQQGGFPPKQSTGFQQHDHSGPPPGGLSSGFPPNQQRPPPGFQQDQQKGMPDSGFKQGGGFGGFDDQSRMPGKFNDEGNFSSGAYPSDNSIKPPGNFQQPPPNVSSSEGYNSRGGFNQSSQQNSNNFSGQRPRFPHEQNTDFRPRFPDGGGPRSRFDGPRGGPMPFRPPGSGGAKQGILGSGPRPLMSSGPGSQHSQAQDKDSETGDVRSEEKKSENEDNRMNDFKDDFDNDNQNSLDVDQQMNQFPGINQRFPGPRGFGDSSGNQRFDGPMGGNLNRPFGQRGGGQFGRGFDGSMRPRFDGPMGRGFGGPMGGGFQGDRGGFNANRGRGFGGAMGRGLEGPRGSGFMAPKGGEFNSPFGQSLDPPKESGETKDKTFNWKDDEDYEDDHGFGASAGNKEKVEGTGTEDQGEMDLDYDENEDQNLEGERRMGFDAPEEKEPEKSTMDFKGSMNFEGPRFPGSRFSGPRMSGDVGSRFQGPRGQEFQGQSGPRFVGPRGSRFPGPQGGPSAPFGAQGPRGPNSNNGPRGPQINQPKPLMSLMDLDVKPLDEDEKKEEAEQTDENTSLKGEETMTSELHSSAHGNADQVETEQEENNEAFENNQFSENFADNNFNEQSSEPSSGPSIRGMPSQRPRFPGAFQGRGFGQRPPFDGQGQRFSGPNFGGPRSGGPRFLGQRPNIPSPRFGQQRPGGPPFQSMGAQIRGPRPQGFPQSDAGTEDYSETYPEEEKTEETYPEEESENTEYQEYVEPEVPYPPVSLPGVRGGLRPMRGQPLNRGPYNGRGGRGMPPMRGQIRPRAPYPIMGAMPPRGGIRSMGAYPPRFQTPYQEPEYDETAEGQNEGEMVEEYDESAMYPAEEAAGEGYEEHRDGEQEADWGAEGEDYSEQQWGTEEYQQDRHKRPPQYPDSTSQEYPEWKEEPRDPWAEPDRVDAYGRRIESPIKRYPPYRQSPPPEYDGRRLGEHEDPYGSRSPSRLYRDRYPPEKPEETPFVFAETIDYGHKSASGNIGFSLEKEITTQEVIDYGHGKSLDDQDTGNMDDFDSRGSSKETDLSTHSLERDIHLREMASRERNSRERDVKDMREMRDRDRDNRDRDRERESRDRDRDRRERDTDRSRSRDLNRDRDRLNGNSSSRDRHGPASQSPSYKPGETRIETVNIDDILCKPGRSSRPPHIVVILRGVPGAGKTYVSKLIREKEVANGGSTPRMLCLDDYFMVEVEKTEKDPETGKMVKKKIMDFEYEEEMEEVYRQSLFKSFKKNIDDGFFNFIILDAVNDRVKHFAEFWSYAKSKGFQVYVITLTSDVATCAKRNTHKRSAEEIQKLSDKWEDTPRHHLRLDIRSLLQEVAITEVEMEDTVPVAEETKSEAKEEDKKPEEDEEDDEPDGVYKKSRWELETSENKLDKLDGINLKKRKRVPSPQSLDEYLQLDELRSKQNEPGKKRVRWADIEEKKHQSHRRELGFVVGQTQRDWERITDESSAHKALNRTKFI